MLFQVGVVYDLALIRSLSLHDIILQINYEHILSWTPEASIPGLDEDAYVDISSQGDGEGKAKKIEKCTPHR
jgi:hypothetical protein